MARWPRFAVPHGWARWNSIPLPRSISTPTAAANTLLARLILLCNQVMLERRHLYQTRQSPWATARHFSTIAAAPRKRLLLQADLRAVASRVPEGPAMATSEIGRASGRERG